MNKYVKAVAIISVALNCLCIKAQDASRNYFTAISVGTQALDYRGTNVGLEVGRRFAGLELGVGLSYYYNPRSFSSIRQQSLSGSWERAKTFDVRLSIGYDLLALARNCERHHLKPYLGLGYAHEDKYGFSITTNAKDLYGWIDHGFEIMPGLCYELDINKRLALGVYVEHDIRVREQTLMGIILRTNL